MESIHTDYLIVGTASEVSRWTKLAKIAGILWCFEHERLDRPQCDHCTRPGYCGIFDSSCMLKIVPIQEAPGFKNKPNEVLLLITPSKAAGADSISIAAAKKLALQLLSVLKEADVCCYEQTVDHGSTWQWQSVREA